MVKRDAAYLNLYSKLEKNSSAFPMKSVEIKFVGAPTSLQLKLGPNLTVIAGSNGAGKSTTLAAAWYLLAGSDRRKLPQRVAHVALAGTHAGTPWRLAVTAPMAEVSAAGPVPSRVAYVDAAAETARILGIVDSDPNFEDLLEGVDSSNFTDDERTLLGRVVGKDYLSVAVREVPDPEDPDSMLPWFELQVAGQSYGLTAMGRGELAAAYLLWRVFRIDEGAVVLFEEPESHLAVRSQTALMDFLVETQRTKKQYYLISSHSPAFLGRLPEGNSVFISADGAGALVHSAATDEIRALLGESSGSRVALLVEDRAAGLLVAALVSRFARSTACLLDIYQLQGEANVRSVSTWMQHVPRGGHRKGLEVLAVLDGDMRELHGESNFWIYLPGSLGPEDYLRRAATDILIKESDLMNAGFLSPLDYKLAMAEAAGQNAHDWLTVVAARLGGLDSVIPKLLTLALQDSEVAEEAKSWVQQVRRRINFR